jgi:hypothetical protein
VEDKGGETAFKPSSKEISRLQKNEAPLFAGLHFFAGKPI